MSDPLAARVFERYVRRQAARHFAGVHWRARGTPARWDPGIPTLLVANHSNWWDGFLAFLVGRSLGLRFHVLMEARHLARYRVFLRLGAIPLHRDHPRAAYADLTAAARLLTPGAGLWVFPQGERRPPDERPLHCERGAAQLALACSTPLRICPVAFRYAFLGEQRPEAFALVGEDWVRPTGGADTRRAVMAEIQAGLEATVDALDDLVAAERLDAFEPLAAGSLSVNKRLDRFRHAVGLLRGPFEARNG
jgi:1-acyl-sn-glycerol-3-phosphate acyltransferase